MMAMAMADDYNAERDKENKLNVKDTSNGKAAKKKKEDSEGISRKVTEIDYEKHEDTAKELDRQEEQEVFAQKAREAAEWCPLDHVHGPNCIRPRPGCSHDHRKEREIYDKTTEEKIKAAERFREEGNEAYRKHNMGLASVQYRKALLQFDYTFAETDEERKWLNKVKSACHLNLAACKTQLEEWDEVYTQCRLALEIDPRSVKAFYRQGCAYLRQDKFELAKAALLSAQELEPKNPEVLQALRSLREKKAAYQSKTR